MVPRHPLTAVALFVLVTLVVTGPLVGVDAVRPQPTTIGDGSATISSVQLPTSELRFTDGRFGTNVVYLRVPDASVSVDSVTGRPRLLYQVAVPALDISLEDEQVLSDGQSGTYRLAPGDRAVTPSSLERDVYRGTVLLRVQSFETAETIVAENVTVQVEQ
ncbi:hypothetical protein SG26_05870 [Haloarcula sp. CBA1115]|uniref:hypothetical protein n=1 Tax=unclassified Haloarcula TaxID=2624677 RepID=UPI000595577F|nr:MULTISPECIES: hypothetical protein [unclassified Haloarcula]AJF25290.1 hypothetical protein SG26_05870 [Haloarcula sp. CBA1115]KAA9406091.1 hypothetical protein Har1131_04450 [Haloarcula sp. CBA1131]